MQFKNKKVLIFGLGSFPEGSGVSAARFFARRGAKVTVTDLKSAGELKETVHLLKKLPVTRYPLPVTLHLGGHQMSDVRGADLVVRNPGVSNNSPYLKEARRRGIPVVTDVSLFMELCPCPVLGVTGTRGKSTTTALLGEMLRRINKKTFVGGNIQRSPLNFLDKLDAGALVVLELSSWLLESLADIKKSPWGVVITNIYPDHLNMHRSMREYVEAKTNIFRFQRPGDIAVFNYDDLTTRRLGRHSHAPEHGSGHYHATYHDSGHTLWFSMGPLPASSAGAFLKKGWIVLRHESAGRGRHEHRLLEVRRMMLRGDHNIANALAATALAHAAGVPISKIAAALRAFRGLPNRQEIIRKFRGVTWVNDTTATSPEAVIAALERFSKNLYPKRYTLDPNIVLIAGGADKNFRSAQFTALARAIKKHCQAVILLPGTATNKLKKLLPTTYYVLRTPKNMREAVSRAKKLAQRGNTVLLSPGAASFGLFKNEFDRGEQFVELVRSLR